MIFFCNCYIRKFFLLFDWYIFFKFLFVRSRMILSNGTSELTSRLLRFQSRSCFTGKFIESKCIKKKLLFSRKRLATFVDGPLTTEPAYVGGRTPVTTVLVCLFKSLITVAKNSFLFLFSSPALFTLTIRRAVVSSF